MEKDSLIELRIPDITFDMPLTDSILELEQLRYKILHESPYTQLFVQIKSIFHMLESIGSSHIEGNNTTVMDYVENSRFESARFDSMAENILEIANIENATVYIENNITEIAIDKKLVRELHQLAVKGLSANGEGALHPGCFRESNVIIRGSSHTPPDYLQVEGMIDELIAFVNTPTTPKYDLIKIALAHHRFVWIHPFENGNGRVVRLFTYALLLKNIFNHSERIINPTAVFCSDRNAYYDHLAQADGGTDEGYIAWAEYVLGGLKAEVTKIDKLMDFNYLRNAILLPALGDALSSGYINDIEYQVLKVSINKPMIQAADLKAVFKEKTSADISRILRRLIDKHMLNPAKEKGRKYSISFDGSYLLRSILRALDKEGFLPNNQ